jgi:hypothetical protein
MWGAPLIMKGPLSPILRHEVTPGSPIHVNIRRSSGVRTSQDTPSISNRFGHFLVQFVVRGAPRSHPRPKHPKNDPRGGPSSKITRFGGPAGGPERGSQSGIESMPEASSRGTPWRDPWNWPGDAAQPNRARRDPKFDYSCVFSTSKTGRPETTAPRSRIGGHF